MKAIGRLWGVLPLALLLAFAGCKQDKEEEGPSKADIRKGIEKRAPLVQRHDAGMDLRNIAQLYCADALGGSPPKKLEDLKGLDRATMQAINDGTYVVLWNAGPNTPGTAVLAYEKSVPTKGGMVANFTGTVLRMSPQEFKAAPKASGN